MGPIRDEGSETVIEGSHNVLDARGGRTRFKSCSLYVWTFDQVPQIEDFSENVSFQKVYTEQMDAAVWGDRLPEVTQKPFLGPKSPALRELGSACRLSIL